MARASKGTSFEPTTIPKLEPEVSLKPLAHKVSSMHVSRVRLNQDHVALYKNNVGVYYGTKMSVKHTYPLENVIHIYHDEKGDTAALEDDCKNQFSIVHGNELERYTWEGRPILLHRNRAKVAHSRDEKKPSSKPTRPLTPPRFEKVVQVKRSWEKSGKPNEALRFSTPQKYCKNFDGTRDPYDHVAQLWQLLFVKGVSNMHMMVHAFGLTMEGQTLLWFQTLKSNV